MRYRIYADPTVPQHRQNAELYLETAGKWHYATVHAGNPGSPMTGFEEEQNTWTTLVMWLVRDYPAITPDELATHFSGVAVLLDEPGDFTDWAEPTPWANFLATLPASIPLPHTAGPRFHIYADPDATTIGRDDAARAVHLQAHDGRPYATVHADSPTSSVTGVDDDDSTTALIALCLAVLKMGTTVEDVAAHFGGVVVGASEAADPHLGVYQTWWADPDGGVGRPSSSSDRATRRAERPRPRVR
jgi:hypothetical protein